MIINLLWIVVVALAVISQWYIIEKKGKYPKKKFWFFTRVGVACVFMYFYLNQGYMWYWALNYMVFTFWFPFNLSLNILRGKPYFYLSPNNSWVDKMVLKVLKHPLVIYGFGFILFLSAIGIMYFYGFCTWHEINNGYCN